MALLFADSFDHYNVADSTDVTEFIRKYWKIVDGTAITIVDGVNPSSYAVRLDTSSNVLNWFVTSLPADFVIGFWFRRGSLGTATQFILITDGAGAANRQLSLSISAANLIELRTSASNTLLATGTHTLAANTWYFIEGKFHIANSLGTATIRVDRQADISFTGDTQATATAQITNISLIGTTQVNDFDDFYLCDTTGSVANDFLTSSGNAGSVTVMPLYSNAAGDSTSFTTDTAGANFDAVNSQFADDDLSYINVSGTGTDLYQFQDLPFAGTVIFGINYSIYCKKTGPGNMTLKRALKTNSTSYSGSTFGVTEEYWPISEPITLNPNTSAAWTRTQINDIQLGIEV